MNGQKSGWTHRFVQATRGETVGEKRAKWRVPAPLPPFDRKPASEGPRRHTTTAIRGPISNFYFFQIKDQIKLRPSKVRLFNIVHGPKQSPIVRRLREKVRKSLMQRLQRNPSRKEKTGAAAIAFRRERGYKKKGARGSGAPTRPD